MSFCFGAGVSQTILVRSMGRCEEVKDKADAEKNLEVISKQWAGNVNAFRAVCSKIDGWCEDEEEKSGRVLGRSLLWTLSSLILKQLN